MLGSRRVVHRPSSSVFLKRNQPAIPGHMGEGTHPVASDLGKSCVAVSRAFRLKTSSETETPAAGFPIEASRTGRWISGVRACSSISVTQEPRG